MARIKVSTLGYTQPMEKALSRTLLVLYLVVLTWLVLFKFSFHASAIASLHARSLNLIPLAASGGMGEIFDNCLFFIPFGLLLSLNFKRVALKRKLVAILLFSLAAEIIQYLFAIGASDITDVITNTLGGLLGLTLYDLGRRGGNDKKLDKAIISTGFVLLLVFFAGVTRVLLHHRR